MAGCLQEPLPIHRQSLYLFGRERRVADVPTDHPSCSKQHAVLQFRSPPAPSHPPWFVSLVFRSLGSLPHALQDRSLPGQAMPAVPAAQPTPESGFK